MTNKPFMWIVFILFFTKMHRAKSQLQTIRCYACFYDKDNPDILASDEDCIKDNFDGSKVGQIGGYRSCFISQYIENGDVVSVLRGGDQSSLTDFSIKTSRNSKDYVTSFCQEDLCNSAPSVGGILVMIAFFVLVSQMQARLTI